MARSIDRRIGLSSGGQIHYVGVGHTSRFICESSSRLHVYNTYLNILITLIISDNGKVSVVKKVSLPSLHSIENYKSY